MRLTAASRAGATLYLFEGGFRFTAIEIEDRICLDSRRDGVRIVAEMVIARRNGDRRLSTV